MDVDKGRRWRESANIQHFDHNTFTLPQFENYITAFELHC